MHCMYMRFIGKYHVTAGRTVLIDVFHIQRDPSTFEDPERFDPNRFLPENVANLNSYGFIPFSAGPRNCVGKMSVSSRSKVFD